MLIRGSEGRCPKTIGSSPNVKTVTPFKSIIKSRSVEAMRWIVEHEGWLLVEAWNQALYPL